MIATKSQIQWTLDKLVERSKDIMEDYNNFYLSASFAAVVRAQQNIKMYEDLKKKYQ
jgi:hypothetical protein